MKPSSTNKNEFTINVHLVKHQVFYTPIYLCKQKGFNLKFTIDDYELSDKKLVEELFKEPKAKDNEIDIFVTGGPDVVDFLRRQSSTEKEKGKVFFWMPVVDRFPLPLITSKSDKKRHSTEGIRDIRNIKQPYKVYSPPEDTTLHYFLSKFYDKTAFRKKYLDGLTNEEQKAIIDNLEKYHSIFEGKLEPQKDFDKIIEKLKQDKSALGFWLADDEQIRAFKKYNPPMEVIVFTCIYTRKDVWENERKRAFLQNFCKHVSLYINELHDFNRHFHRKKNSNDYDIKVLEPVFEILSDTVKTDAQKMLFISNLKFLAQNRIFATNINNDLVLLGDEIQKQDDKKVFEPFYKLKLYYWISEGFVKNAFKEIDDLHEKEMAQMELLKNISASTHNFKTTINTLFSAPLNSLRLQQSDDRRIELLTQAKETLLLNSELVNLLSKLSIPGYGKESKEKALIDSKLFAESSKKIDLKKIITDRLEIWHLDTTNKLKEIVLTNKNEIILDADFLKYENLFPTERFFEMIVLTIIENCSRHAELDENYKVALSVTASKRELVFSNKKENSKSPDALTGNLRIIDSLLILLDNIGKVSFPHSSGNFQTKISNLKGK